MSDIAERLLISVELGSVYGSRDLQAVCARQMLEAANEIGRLRAELAARDAAAVDAIAQAYEDGRISACNAGKPGCPRVAALEAECARLREVPEGAVESHCYTYGTDDPTSAATVVRCRVPSEWSGSEVYIIRKEPKS